MYFTFIQSYIAEFSKPKWKHKLDGLCSLASYKMITLFPGLYKKGLLEIVYVNQQYISVPDFEWNGHDFLCTGETFFDPTAPQLGLPEPRIFTFENVPEVYGQPTKWAYISHMKYPLSNIYRDFAEMKYEAPAWNLHSNLYLKTCDIIYNKVKAVIAERNRELAELENELNAV